MRISSGAEGQRIRVDMQTGGLERQSPRFSAILSNVAAPALGRADSSRMVNITLGDAVQDWPAVEGKIIRSMALAPGVRSRIIRETGAIVARVKEKTHEFQGLGMGSREALASAALTVGWQWWGVDEEDVYSTDDHDRNQNDAEDCLAAIMSVIVRDPGGAGKTLGKAISSDPATVKDLYGIRYDGLEGLMVGYGHRGLKDGLRGTPWEKADLRSVLMQLDGATVSKNPLRISPVRMRCVNIPHATLIKVIEIGETEE